MIVKWISFIIMHWCFNKMCPTFAGSSNIKQTISGFSLLLNALISYLLEVKKTTQYVYEKSTNTYTYEGSEFPVWAAAKQNATVIMKLHNDGYVEINV